MESKRKLSNITPTVNAVKVRSCAANACKGIMYLFNMAFGIAGFAVIGIAGWVLRHELSSDLAIILNTQLYRLGAVIIVLAGCTIVVISIVGMLGIRQENKCFLLGYIVTLIVIFCMVFIAGIFCVAIYTRAENELEFQMLNTLKTQYGPGGNEEAQDPMTAAWNNIQGTYDCCGVKTNTSGAEIYKRSIWYRDLPIIRRTKVPVTCCVEASDGGDVIDQKDCQSNFNGYDNVYRKGCYDAVLRQVATFVLLISASSVGVTVIQLLGLAFSFFILRQL